jgi:hypothetical protein
MAVDLTLLDPGFQTKLSQLLKQLKNQGIEMRPNEGLRTPFVQAKYWRQSRSKEQIVAKIAELKSKGAPFLAQVLDSVGPQSGDPVTNSIPGLSWHQFGEALDCFWVVNGEANWSTTKLVNGVNGYKEYAKAASSLGLDAGGLWKSLKDWPHVQLRKDASPLGKFTLQQIDGIMKERFGGAL